jgi:hypothetical protein
VRPGNYPARLLPLLLSADWGALATDAAGGNGGDGDDDVVAAAAAAAGTSAGSGAAGPSGNRGRGSSASSSRGPHQQQQQQKQQQAFQPGSKVHNKLLDASSAVDPAQKPAYTVQLVNEPSDGMLELPDVQVVVLNSSDVVLGRAEAAALGSVQVRQVVSRSQVLDGFMLNTFTMCCWVMLQRSADL